MITYNLKELQRDSVTSVLCILTMLQVTKLIAAHELWERDVWGISDLPRQYKQSMATLIATYFLLKQLLNATPPSLLLRELFRHGLLVLRAQAMHMQMQGLSLHLVECYTWQYAYAPCNTYAPCTAYKACKQAYHPLSLVQAR